MISWCFSGKAATIVHFQYPNFMGAFRWSVQRNFCMNIITWCNQCFSGISSVIDIHFDLFKILSSNSLWTSRFSLISKNWGQNSTQFSQRLLWIEKKYMAHLKGLLLSFHFARSNRNTIRFLTHWGGGGHVVLVKSVTSGHVVRIQQHFWVELCNCVTSHSTHKTAV